MAAQQSEYARAGVDYRKIEPFKAAMQEVGRTTLAFPNKRNVHVGSDAHGCTFWYQGTLPHYWCNTQEGLGNKNWIAELIYAVTGDATVFEGIAIDAALMAVNDVLAQGALPVVYTDEVAAGDSEWFADEKRAQALARGFFRVCQEAGMALPAGESPALKYLIKAEPPVKSAPSLSGCVTGIIAPKSRRIPHDGICLDDAIIGFPSSGIHANGISLIIKRAQTLPKGFFTPLSTGRTLGEEVLIPTRSYVADVERLLEARVDIHALLPGTGSGLGKIAFDKRDFTYRIQRWVDVPPIFQFMRELGVTQEDCLQTFNWGIGYYAFIPRNEVDRVLMLCPDSVLLGSVEEGPRRVVFEPERIILSPPGD